LKKQGLLRRFSITCYGKQKTLEDIRTEKAKQYKKLKTKKKSNEYDKWFLRYNPELNKKIKPLAKQKKSKEDIINEAKLAFEAKAITSKVVIEELEKINKSGKKTRKNNTTSNISFVKNKPLKEQLLFIQNEFTPSNAVISLTDDKLYVK
jgi:hypothetical protein